MSLIEPFPNASHESWASHCAGWRFGAHEKLRVEDDGRWRCRWCYQIFNPPTKQEMDVNRARMMAAPTVQRNPIRRMKW